MRKAYLFGFLLLLIVIVVAAILFLQSNENKSNSSNIPTVETEVGSFKVDDSKNTLILETRIKDVLKEDNKIIVIYELKSGEQKAIFFESPQDNTSYVIWEESTGSQTPIRVASAEGFTEVLKSKGKAVTALFEITQYPGAKPSNIECNKNFLAYLENPNKKLRCVPYSSQFTISQQ